MSKKKSKSVAKVISKAFAFQDEIDPESVAEIRAGLNFDDTKEEEKLPKYNVKTKQTK